jgi:hypothetical protein
MAADIFTVVADLGMERFEYAASDAGTTTNGILIEVDTDSAATDTPKTKGELIEMLERLIEFIRENDYPPA